MLQTGVHINYDSSARTYFNNLKFILFSVVEFVLKATEDIFKDGIYVLIILTWHSLSRKRQACYGHSYKLQERK